MNIIKNKEIHHLCDVFFITVDQDNKSNHFSPHAQSKASMPSAESLHLENKDSLDGVVDKQTVESMMSKIAQEFVTFRYWNYSGIENLRQKINEELQNYKLTKRRIVFAIMIRKQLLQRSRELPLHRVIHFGSTKSCENSLRELSPQRSPFLADRVVRTSSVVGNKIFISLEKTEQKIRRELIKHMKLEFIWIGLVSKLGTDINDLLTEIAIEENFEIERIEFYSNFMKEFERLVAEQQQKAEVTELNSQQLGEERIKQMLETASTFCESKSGEVNQMTESLILSKFNSRIVISDISMGEYLHLLMSRNYFNLIMVEDGLMNRFKLFKLECEIDYPHLHKWLDLEKFILMDDYWHHKHILPVVEHVKFTISRYGSNVPYSEVIKKNFNHIIPSFRPTFDEYFISICNVLKERSGCVKEAVGSIVVKDKRILSTGYNGTPLNCVNCFNGGCKVCNNSEKMNTEVLSCSCIHAEYGCILEAGIKVTLGATLYSTKLPCLWCSKLIIQSRIAKIVYLKSKYSQLEYQNMDLILGNLKKANIQLVEFQVNRKMLHSE